MFYKKKIKAVETVKTCKKVTIKKRVNVQCKRSKKYIVFKIKLQ